jgi:hypothetical protein
MGYRGTTKNVRQISQDLGVTTLIEAGELAAIPTT